MILSFANFTEHKMYKAMVKNQKPENKLYDWLMTSKLFFIPRGRFHKSFVYNYVENILPELCVNDEVKYGGKRNEWQKNGVDFALSELKKMKIIKQNKKDEGKGYYTFI
jgi:hypothetical protein